MSKVPCGKDECAGNCVVLPGVTSNAILLNAVQMAYRKHCLSDDSIGWAELDDILLSALCEAMTDEGYLKWLKTMKI